MKKIIIVLCMISTIACKKELTEGAAITKLDIWVNKMPAQQPAPNVNGDQILIGNNNEIRLNTLISMEGNVPITLDATVEADRAGSDKLVHRWPTSNITVHSAVVNGVNGGITLRNFSRQMLDELHAGKSVILHLVFNGPSVAYHRQVDYLIKR